MSTLFIQITPETTQHTIASNLTKMQYRLWLFLYHLDPFGDRPVLIPTPAELAAQLNMSVRSIYRALQKLSELGLFTIASKYTRSITNGVKNQPLGTKKLRSRIFKGCAKNVTVVPEMSSTLPKLSQECQNRQNQPPQPNTDEGFTAPQTNTDNKKTFSELEGNENQKFNNQQPEILDFCSEDNTNNSLSIATLDPDEESIAADVEQLNENNRSNIEAELIEADRAVEILPSCSGADSNRVANWLPPGPWSIEGKLDPNFRDWLAKDWIARYGGTIHQKRGDVLAHFKKDPANLPIRWEQYQGEYLDRARNAQTRMNGGMSIDPTEQQQLIKHTAALTKCLPAAMSPVARTKQLPRSRILDRGSHNSKEKAVTARALDPASDSSTVTNNPNSNIPENAENPDAYKLWQPEFIEPVDPNTAIDLLKNALTMPKVQTAPTQTENSIDILNSWLTDPILYPEAIARAKKLGYNIDYNENDRAVKISVPE